MKSYLVFLFTPDSGLFVYIDVSYDFPGFLFFFYTPNILCFALKLLFSMAGKCWFDGLWLNVVYSMTSFAYEFDICVLRTHLFH